MGIYGINNKDDDRYLQITSLIPIPDMLNARKIEILWHKYAKANAFTPKPELMQHKTFGTFIEQILDECLMRHPRLNSTEILRLYNYVPIRMY